MSEKRICLSLLASLVVSAIHLAAIAAEELDEGPGFGRGGYTGPYLVTDFQDGGGFRVSGPASWEGGLLKADFAKGDGVSLSHSLSLLGKPRGIELTLRGGKPGNRVIMDLGSHFQTFTRVLGELNGTETVLAVPAPPEGWDFHGGENDGVARDPLRVTRIAVERGTGPAEPAEVQFVALRCETRVPRARAATLVTRLDPGDTTADRQAFTASVICRNVIDAPLAGVLALSVVDWDGNALYTAEQPAELPPAGVPVSITQTFDVPAALHFVEARFAFTADGQRPAEHAATFTAPLDTVGDATPLPESPWGMGVYLYRYGGDAAGLANMDRAASLAQAAGVKWSREEFSWAQTEPSKGVFDFSYYDEIVATAERHGISVYGLLAYWSNWTAPYTLQGIDDFCAWTRAAVARYRGRIHHWEVYNEPNIFFWAGPRELYPVLLTRAYAAIKETDPDAQVLGLSTSGIDNAFISQCLEAKAPFDVLTIHPYRGNLVEKIFMDELRATRGQVGGRPVWITEMGWPTYIGGATERAQAELLARTYLSAIASGACQNISWYDFKNDGEDPFYNESNFGVLYSDMRPKPAYRALATVCNTFSNGPFRGRDDFGPSVHVLDSPEAFALWTADQPTEAACKVEAGTPEVRNLMGDPVPVTPDGGLFRFTLQPGRPVFISKGKDAPGN